MIISQERSLLGVVVAALAAAAFVVQAAPGKSAGSGGWESSADHLESVVVSIKSSPVLFDEDGEAVAVDEEATEAACVAVQIGMNLLMSELKNCVGETTATVTPVDEVNMFLTLGGVEAVGPQILNPDIPAPMCVTPCGLKPLTTLINAFADMPGAGVVICPLCWSSRYCDPNEGCEDPAVGSVLNGVQLHDLFLFADKVIDF